MSYQMDKIYEIIKVMLSVIENLDLFCVILKYLNFQELISLRCVCRIFHEWTYHGIIQNCALHKCDRRMAHILFQTNVRLKDAAVLVEKHGGWNSAKERLVQKRENFKKKSDRLAKLHAGRLWGPQYYDHNTGKFVDTCIYASNHC